MTQEEKARAYDKAIEKVNSKWHYKNQPCFVDAAEIFPELAESDDEKIRKEIFHFILDNTLSTDMRQHRWLAWLEKQGEDKKEINNFNVLPGLYKCVHRMFDGTPDGKLLFEVDNVYKCLSKHDRAEFEVSYGHSVYLEDPVVCKHFIPLEKQGEQNSPILSNSSNIGKDLQVDGKIHNIYYSDKVEPKFKVGDWIVNKFHDICLITDIDLENDYYICESNRFGNTDGDIDLTDKAFHLWHLGLSKDGDVLFHSDTASNGIFIFKEVRDGKVLCHCDFDSEDHFRLGEYHNCCWVDDNIKPATKEQCDLLFEKMREAGYEWNEEKKELRKVKQKPKWTEEDENMFSFIQKKLTSEVDDWLESLKKRMEEQQ